jgi:hypothetical protein
MLKYLSIAVLALSFNLAPVANASDAPAESAKVVKADKHADNHAKGKAHKGHADKECECKGKSECACEKKDCDSGECMKKDSKKYCKHCSQHDNHHEGESHSGKNDEHKSDAAKKN